MAGKTRRSSRRSIERDTFYITPTKATCSAHALDFGLASDEAVEILEISVADYAPQNDQGIESGKEAVITVGKNSSYLSHSGSDDGGVEEDTLALIGVMSSTELNIRKTFDPPLVCIEQPYLGVATDQAVADQDMLVEVVFIRRRSTPAEQLAYYKSGKSN